MAKVYLEIIVVVLMVSFVDLLAKVAAGKFVDLKAAVAWAALVAQRMVEEEQCFVE